MTDEQTDERTDRGEAGRGGDRRDFMGKLCVACGGAIGVALAVPAGGYLLSPLWKDNIRSDASESRLGPVSAFEVGKPVKVPITAARTDGWVTDRDVTIGSVWVVRTRAEPPEFRVMSAICPHLGCAVNVADDGFRCPCHDSRFTAAGARIDGGERANPAPRDMDVIAHEIREDALYCRYQRFRTGIPEQVAVDKAPA